MKVFEETMGPDAPGLAWTLTNMARLDIKQGKLADAQARLERGLAIREKVFGASHVENAFSLVWLGELAVDRGQYSEGAALVRRALSLLEGEPPGPPTVLARGFDVRGRIEAAQGRLAEAESDFQRGSALREKRSPAGSPRYRDRSGTPSRSPACRRQASRGRIERRSLQGHPEQAAQVFVNRLSV